MADYPYRLDQSGDYPSLSYPDTDVTDSAGWLSPAIKSMKPLLWANANKNNDLTRRNLANRQRFRVIGTPTYTAPGIVRTSRANHFASWIRGVPRWTAFIYGRRSDTSAGSSTQGVFMANFLGASDPGDMIWWQASTVLRAQVTQATNDIETFNLSVASNSDKMKRYRIQCDRDPTSGVGTLQGWNDTDNTTNSAEPLEAAPQLGNLAILLGAAQSSVITGHVEWNHISLWPGIPTSDERAAHWAQVISIAEDIGVIEGA